MTFFNLSTVYLIPNYNHYFYLIGSVALSGLQFTGSQFSSSSLAELTTTTTVEPKSTMRSKLETVRKKFPDTWLFLNVSAEYVKSCNMLFFSTQGSKGRLI
jgi:hypothetical protein